MTRDDIPPRRVNVTDRLRFHLLVRDIDEASGEYIEVLARTRPQLAADGWRVRVRREVEQLAGVQAAADLLDLMNEAVEEGNRQR